MRLTFCIAALALALAPAGLAFAQEAEEPTGCEVVERGVRGSLTGTLVAEGDEWQLRVAGKLYDLHLGQFGHDGATTAALKDGAEATVYGFIEGSHVSPVTLTSAGATIRFREEDGRPRWAGMRLGPNAVEPVDGADPRGPADGAGSRGTGWGRNRPQG